MLACIWIAIGKLDTPGYRNGWVTVYIESKIEGDISEYSDEEYSSWVWNHSKDIYANAFYFILMTITTVGYGDITGSTTYEYIFSMIVEFIGLTFFSFLTGTINIMFSKEQSFETMINEHLDQLDLWMLRLENCN